MTGRVKVIKRRAVTTGQLRRRAEAALSESDEASVESAGERAAPETIAEALAAAVQVPAAPQPASSATVEVVSLSPEATELHVRCACGCETVIALNHPAEGGAA